MIREVYVQNFSVKSFKSPRGKDMFLIKMQDYHGVYNIVISDAYFRAILENAKPEVSLLAQQLEA